MEENKGMLRINWFKALAVALTLMMVTAFSACAESIASKVEELEKKLCKNLNYFTFSYFLSDCYDLGGEELAREKAIYYASLFPDEPDIVWGIIIYCNPVTEPDRIIEAASTMLRAYDLPAYREDMPEKPHPNDLSRCASAHLVCVYAYYQLGDEANFVTNVDWLLSYAGYAKYHEAQFSGAVSAADYATGYFTEIGNDEKALYYARQVEAIISKYGDQYPELVEKFSPEYEVTIAPVLEKYAHTNEP